MRFEIAEKKEEERSRIIRGIRNISRRFILSMLCVCEISYLFVYMALYLLKTFAKKIEFSYSLVSTYLQFLSVKLF